MTFAENLSKWNQAKTRLSERRCHAQVINSISDDEKISEGQWDKVFRAAYHVYKKFPDTAQDKKEMESLFRNSPEYPGPLPQKKGEVFVTFLSKKRKIT